MKRKPIYNAVKLASAMMAMGAVSLNAAAQDDQEVEELIVLGSNIPRAVSDAAQPISVIDSLDIELSGFTNTADILRNSAYNSFGSFRERSGTSFGQIATADLRGLGSQYTAVLINGRRVPGSPFTGSSIVDLNTIPISSVERVEILKDGASAIYGADAIGGVINITLKDDYEGFEVGGGASRPSLEGGESENFNVLWGKTYSRGNIMAGAEYFNREAVFDRDRPYSAAQVNGPDFGDTVGISVGGNTGFLPDFSEAFPLGSCDESLYAGVFTNPFGVPGTGCGYAYANQSLQTGNLERKSVFINGNYEINDSMTAYVDARLNQNETSGRYAPAVGFFSFSGDSPLNPRGEDISAFHRFVAHGDRDSDVDLDELTIIGGLKGEFKNGIGYDVWAQAYEYDAIELGNTYVQTSVLEAEVTAGRYDVFNPLSQDPTHLEAVRRSSIELTRDINTSYQAVGATFNGTLGELSGGEIGWAAGVEYASEDYQDIYDDLREAGDVTGSAGNSASGERDRSAIFTEILLPVTENLEVNVAARYDDYDLFGGNFSPQVAAKYTLNDNFKFRASVGEGFKAPDLTQLFGELAQSFDGLRDQFRCTAQGIAPGDCPNFQVENFTGGNTELEAEDSENFNIGVIADIGGFSASLDYYNVKIEGQVQSPSLAQINALEATNALPSGVVVNRAPATDGIPGAIRSIIRPFANTSLVDTSGLDLNASLSLESGIGNWDLGLQWVHILDYDLQSTENDDPTDIIGGSATGGAFPENRINTNIRLNTGDLTLSLNSQFIDGFRNPTDTDDYGSWLSHDVTVNWVNAFGVDGLDLTGGVQNLTEETPRLDPNGSYDAGIVLTTYSVYGRVPFVNFKYSFGQ